MATAIAVVSVIGFLLVLASIDFGGSDGGPDIHAY
jgi:hypothetical protein